MPAKAGIQTLERLFTSSSNIGSGKPELFSNIKNSNPTFRSLEFDIWILSFDQAQDGELVEPVVICHLMLGIFSI